MTGARDVRLDPRVWLVWSIAASVPALVGRNPFTLVAVTIAVIGVRLAWQPAAAGLSSWRWVIRLALIFAVVGVIFNVLTYHGGDIEIIRVPGRVPLLGGPLTLNALVYGVLSGWALLLLVLIGTTVGALIDWPALLRLVPQRLTTFAVAGSVAFAFLPQTANAYREILEAQAIRGHRVSRARDLPPILVPLLTGGLERAITMAEALESRAFGAPFPQESGHRTWTRFTIPTLVVTVLAGAFLLFEGYALFAVIVVAIGAVGVLLPSGSGGPVARTSYRRSHWSRIDSVVTLAAALALAAVIATLVARPAGLRYEPYPTLDAPIVNVPLLVALCLLILPAFAAPTSRSSDEGVAP